MPKGKTDAVIMTAYDPPYVARVSVTDEGATVELPSGEVMAFNNTQGAQDWCTSCNKSILLGAQGKIAKVQSAIRAFEKAEEDLLKANAFLEEVIRKIRRS